MTPFTYYSWEKKGKRVRILFHEIRGDSGKFRGRFVQFLLSFDNVCEHAIRSRLKKPFSLSLSLSFIAIRRDSRRSFIDCRGEPSEINVATEGSRTVERKPPSLWKDRF